MGTPGISRVTHATERVLNPVLGKSKVVYARKPLDDDAAGNGTATCSADPRPSDVELDLDFDRINGEAIGA
jgi:hypothetical protein